MTTQVTDLRDFDISKLSFADLQQLRLNIDERIDAIRHRFIEDAAALGLACDAHPVRGRRKQRRNSHRQQQEE